MKNLLFAFGIFVELNLINSIFCKVWLKKSVCVGGNWLCNCKYLIYKYQSYRTVKRNWILSVTQR